MTDVTRILSQIEQGDPDAADQLLPLVYDELRKLAASKMAAENPGQTLQATALVHEAYLRLTNVDQRKHWDSRGHFFAAAAEAMRRILIESARKRKSSKSGGGHLRVEMDDFTAASATDPDLLLDLDAGLSRLSQEDPRAAKLVKLRLFVGLSVTDAGKMLGISRTTAYEDWEFARTWFAAHLDAQE